MEKFKVGDRVRVVEGAVTFAPKRLIGTVEDVTTFGCVSVRWPGWGDGMQSDPEKWSSSDDTLELVPPATFLVVYSEPGDVTYATQEEAESNAQEMARNEIGSKFSVLRVVATVEANAPVVVTERAA